MTRTDELRGTNKAERNRLEKARAAGMRPQQFFLPTELLAYLDEVKAAMNFRRRDQAAAFLIRDAMQHRVGHSRKDEPTVMT